MSARLIVITGGPGTGKTSLIEALAERGWASVPEAAIEVIGELNEEMGLERQKEWRHAHRGEFQGRVLARQRELEEAALASGESVVFLDRSRVDGLAYCRYFNENPPPELVRAAGEIRFDDVVWLEQLRTFPERAATGRTSDRTASIALGSEIATVYAELGFELLRLEDRPLAERTDLLLQQLGLPQAPVESI